MAQKTRYTGHLYQLFSARRLRDGAFVRIDGPWDTYGTVTSSKFDEGKKQWLNQVRGCKPATGQKVEAHL